MSSVANCNGTLVHPAVRGWPEGRDYIEVYVSAVANPGLFWIQPLSSTSADLDDLVDRITSLYTSEMSKVCYLPLHIRDVKGLLPPFTHQICQRFVISLYTSDMSTVSYLPLPIRYVKELLSPLHIRDVKGFLPPFIHQICQRIVISFTYQRCQRLVISLYTSKMSKVSYLPLHIRDVKGLLSPLHIRDVKG